MVGARQRDRGSLVLGIAQELTRETVVAVDAPVEQHEDAIAHI